MGFLDIFGGSRKKAEEEERLAAQQKEEEHQRKVEEARKAHEGMPWPGIMKINLMKSKDAKPEETVTAPEDPISAERKDEIGQLVFEPDLQADQMTPLTLQEVMFLLDTQILFNKKAPLPNYEQNHRVVYNDLLRRIHEAEKVYVLYNRITGYPMLDGPFAQVYLDKDHADTAAKMYQQQYRVAVVMERPGEAAPDLPDGKKQISFFDYLYYLGIENILIDNGWYKAAIKRSEISAPPTAFVVGDDQKNTPPASPALAFAMLDFTNEATWPVKYDKREQNLKTKMARINALIPVCRYVVPVQEATGEDAEKIKAQGGRNPIRMPLVKVKAKNKTTGEEEDRNFLPVFTDLFEYAKGFRQEGFRPAVFEFRALLGVMGGAEGIVINPRGASIIVPKAEALKMLQAVLQKQQGAAQGQNPAVFAQAAAKSGPHDSSEPAKVLQFPGTQPEKETPEDGKTPDGDKE